MPAVAILVTILACLVLAIPATLAMILCKITRARTQRQSRCIVGLPPSLSAGSIEKHVGFLTSIKLTQSVPPVDIPTICVSTATSFHSLDFLEAIHNDVYDYQNNQVYSSDMYESVVYHRSGPHAIAPRRIPQVLVDIGASTPVAFAYVFPTCHSEEDIADTMGLYYRKDESPPFDMEANGIFTESDEEYDESEIINAHIAVPNPHITLDTSCNSSISLSIASGNITTVTELNDCNFHLTASHPSSSAKASDLPTLVEEDEVLGEDDCLSEFAYLSSRASSFTAFGLASIAENDKEIEDRDSLDNHSNSAFDHITAMNDFARDCPSHGQPSIAITNKISFHTPLTPEAISLDPSRLMGTEAEEISDSHLDHHWQPTDSVTDYDYKAVDGDDGDACVEASHAFKSSLSEMDDEEALAWAHSFMLGFNAAAAVLAASPGYDLEDDHEYEEDECRHPISPILESIAEEEEGVLDDEDVLSSEDDGDLNSEWNVQSPNSSISSCSCVIDANSWKNRNRCACAALSPRSVHRFNLPVDPYTPPYFRPGSRLSFNAPLA